MTPWDWLVAALLALPPLILIVGEVRLRRARRDWDRITREAEALTRPIGPEDDPDWNQVTR